MQADAPHGHEPNLLLDLPPLALQIIVDLVPLKLTKVSKSCRDLVLDHANFLNFKPKTVQQVDELSNVLGRRRSKLRLKLDTWRIGEEVATAMFYRIANSPRPNGQCAVKELELWMAVYNFQPARTIAGWGPLLGGAFKDIKSLTLCNGTVGEHLFSGLAVCRQLSNLCVAFTSLHESANSDQLAHGLPVWLPAVRELDVSRAPAAVLQGLAPQLTHLQIGLFESESARQSAALMLHSCRQLVSFQTECLDDSTLGVLLQLEQLKHVKVRSAFQSSASRSISLPVHLHSWESLHIGEEIPFPLHMLAQLPIAKAQRVQLDGGVCVDIQADAEATAQAVAADVAALAALKDVLQISTNVQLVWAPGAQSGGTPRAAICAAVRALQPLLLDKPGSMFLHLPERTPLCRVLWEGLFEAIEHARGSSLEQLHIECTAYSCSSAVFATLRQRLPCLTELKLFDVKALDEAALCSLSMLCAAHSRPLKIGLLTEEPSSACRQLHEQVSMLKRCQAQHQSLVEVEAEYWEADWEESDEDEEWSSEGEGQEGEDEA